MAKAEKSKGIGRAAFLNLLRQGKLHGAWLCEGIDGEQMRSAVEKGFEQAGAAFKEHFGAKDTPQITKDTYAEIMKRFDDKAAEWKNAANTQNTATATNSAGIAVKTDETA